jgi:ribosomal protein L16 Arg81 hydroxylase
MMLIGNEGAGMFNHVDVLRTASWQIQLEGAKMWHLCGPDQNANMYGAGLIDVWNPDYEKYPRFAQADCFEDTIRKGEFIYYPADYWHQTRKYVS